ncbi:MAG: hypothetical protein COB67_08830 [SAR324 cluster bacterium]|uniref:Uncharacterized protein n=1 Tax=SAR324 cluster bacterium TaxID=2024889 RepID=A0A2A4T1L6_9DELT|nr:MAG: hypothetical protein COB67_08830 [SAR324 cluster bacterium]
MVRKSHLPGRVRYEEKSLIGDLAKCSFIARKLEQEVGILEAEVNYRTGRLLLRYDEVYWSQEELKSKFIELIHQRIDFHVPLNTLIYQEQQKHSPSKKGYGGLIVTVASQLMLPVPLNRIVPMVYKGMVG